MGSPQMLVLCSGCVILWWGEELCVPFPWAPGSWVACGLLSPWLGAFETNAGGDTDRSQETWILASLRLGAGMGHPNRDWIVERPCWGCRTEWSRTGGEGDMNLPLMFFPNVALFYLCSRRRGGIDQPLFTTWLQIRMATRWDSVQN